MDTIANKPYNKYKTIIKLCQENGGVKFKARLSSIETNQNRVRDKFQFLWI